MKTIPNFRYNFYTDPGHGWLRVPTEALHTLDIIDKISGYSYYDSEYVYLEEDCDMQVFVNALAELYGFEEARDFYPLFDQRMRTFHTDGDSVIRSLNNYSPKAITAILTTLGKIHPEPSIPASQINVIFK